MIQLVRKLDLWGNSSFVGNLQKASRPRLLVHFFFKEEAPNAGTPLDPVNSDSSLSPASSILFFYEWISGRRSFSFSMRLKKRPGSTKKESPTVHPCACLRLSTCLLSKPRQGK
jgi:hypothetical protein